MSAESPSTAVDGFLPAAVVVPPTPVPSAPPSRRVLHLVNGEFYSGAERVQDLLAASLVNSGYAIDFACLKDGKFAAARSYQQAALHPCYMSSRLDFRVVNRVCELVDREGYQVIHAHTPRSLMVGNLAAARRKIPLVYHVHSPTSRDSTRSLMNRLNAVTERLSMTGVKRIITVSKSLAEHVASLGFDNQLITVVPNGVPVATPADRGLPTRPWRLGTIALFRPRKGTEVLLAAIQRLCQDGYDIRLTAVGSFETASYEQQLKDLTTEYGLQDRVDWVGFQSDINEYLSQMDLFVLPSLFGEGMPMVVLEAMAMGLPVVGTSVEGVPEVVRDGLDGRIAQPGDARALSAAIASIVDGELDWQTVRKSVIERQRQCFSDRSMAAGVAAVYDELLEVVKTDLRRPELAR